MHSETIGVPISVGHIVDALSSLGGEAHLDQIIERVLEIAPQPIPRDPGASVRGRIQERCAETASYKGGVNLFESVHGIKARRGVWRLRDVDQLNSSNPDAIHDGADAFIESEEGRAILRIHLRRERSHKLIATFKASLRSFACQACGFDFEKTYGELGSGYIEAHHTIPVAALDEDAKSKVSDLVGLCANCHRVIHRNGLMSVADLQILLCSRKEL